MTLSQGQISGQTGNDHEFFDFKPHGDHLAPQPRNIVFVGAADFSDEAMGMKPFDHAGDLGACFSGQLTPQVFVLETADSELSACYGFKKQLVLVIEEVETFVGAGAVGDGFSDFLKFVDPGGRIIDSGDELQVPTVGRKQELLKSRERIDALFHLGLLF